MADEKKVLDQNGLLYYHQGIKQIFLSDIAYNTTAKKFTKTKNGQITDVVTASALKTDMALNNVGNFKAVSTVANQGLTEEEKANARSNIGAGSSAFSGDFADLANIPTTIAGYGITDADISSGTITLGANTITPLTSDDVNSTYSATGTAPVNGAAINAALSTLTAASTGGTGKYIQAISETNGVISATAQTMDTAPTSASKKAVTSGGVYTALSSKADTSTTLAGYGITDANISGGTITLGGNTITPLTEHQDISGKADVATTIAGYGITDAKIANGTITLGANTFKGVSVAANQGLTATEKENARANLGISLAELYKYKGSVATVAALDAIATKAVGDVYNVTANGKNYAWTGSEWDDLGGEFSITTITNAEIDTILSA